MPAPTLDDLRKEKLLKPADVAKQLGVSVELVNYWARRGILRRFKMSRTVRIPESAVNEFLARWNAEPEILNPPSGFSLVFRQTEAGRL